MKDLEDLWRASAPPADFEDVLRRARRRRFELRPGAWLGLVPALALTAVLALVLTPSPYSWRTGWRVDRRTIHRPRAVESFANPFALDETAQRTTEIVPDDAIPMLASVFRPRPPRHENPFLMGSVGVPGATLNPFSPAFPAPPAPPALPVLPASSDTEQNPFTPETGETLADFGRYTWR